MSKLNTNDLSSFGTQEAALSKMDKTIFKNPKQKRVKGDTGPRIPTYNYYAGYSLPFVQSVLDYLRLENEAYVLDPWNGSGTTTRGAKLNKINSIGFDLNPVTLVIARAGLIDWSTIATSIIPLSEFILSQDDSLNANKSLARTHKDPFDLWFTTETVKHLRSLELTVRSSLVGLSTAQTTQFSPLAAFFYLAMFRMARELTKPFQGSNPTWIKTAKTSEERISIAPAKIRKCFSKAISDLVTAFSEWDAQQFNCNNALDPEFHPDIRLGLADSQQLPIPDQSVDAVITSPPYCTRIDYIVATLPELAVLGVSTEESDHLRRRMLGANTVPQTSPRTMPEWGEACRTLLHTIESHPSRASSTYYIKWATQYFATLYFSLREINRVLRPNTHCAIVVQNSYYKEIMINLQSIICEMTASFSWKLEGEIKYSNNSSFASINPKSKAYREKNDIQESVLIFSNKIQ